MEEKETYGIQEIADKYGISYQAVSKRITRDNLEVINKNGKLSLPQSSYDELVKYYENKKKMKEEKKLHEGEVLPSPQHNYNRETRLSREVEQEFKEKILGLNNSLSISIKQIEHLKTENERLSNEKDLWKNMYLEKDKALNEVSIKNANLLVEAKKEKKSFFKRILGR